MDYTPLIYLDADTKERLISYLDSELLNHYAERGQHIDDLIRMQKDYWAAPTNKVATFPFEGAATIIIPLSAIAVEATHARGMTQVFALNQIVSAQAIDPDWETAERPVERFLNSELIGAMRIRRPIGDCFLEAAKFGTMIGKVGYEKEIKVAVREESGVTQKFYVTTKDGAVFDSVPDARFLMPYYATDPETSPWAGEEHSRTPYDVMNLERAGMFYDGTIIGENSKLNAWINQTQIQGKSGGVKFERSQEELDSTTPVYPKMIDWVEVALAFDVDQDNELEEIIVHYHRDSRTLMAVRYNWWDDLRKGYRVNVYFPIEHRWRGIGLCKMNEQFQKEITTQHRQRIDNATVANMRMFKIHKMSGYGPGEPIFPGKQWFLDDMSHIEAFQVGEVYNSSYNNEQSAVIYSQQRTGVNELTLGMPQVGTPGTATSDLSRIQEGMRKWDFVFENFKEFTTQIIVDIACTIQQYGPRRLSYFDYAQSGQLIKQFFEMPTKNIRDGVLINLRATSQQRNRLAERQDWQQIAIILQQYIQGMVQLAEALQDQKLLQIVLAKGMLGITEAMRQILETFDVNNIDRIIIREVEGLVRNGLAQSGVISGGNGGSTPFGQAQTMDFINQAIQAIGGNGGQPINRIREFA